MLLSSGVCLTRLALSWSRVSKLQPRAKSGPPPALICCSVAQSCLTRCDPMDCSMPGYPVLYQLLEPAQTHVYLVSDAIQPSHPLSSLSPSAFNLSQHQGLFK